MVIVNPSSAESRRLLPSVYDTIRLYSVPIVSTHSNITYVQFYLIFIFLNVVANRLNKLEKVTQL